MNYIEKKIIFTTQKNILLHGRFTIPQSSQKKKFPVVVMLTGDGQMGSKSLSWTNLPPLLAENDIASFVFDFEGLGYSSGERKNLCLSIGLSNVKVAMQQVYLEHSIDHNKIGLFGASFGGAIALLYTSKNSSIKSLGLKTPVSFYPDSFLTEFGVDLLEQWRNTGYLESIGFDYNFYLDAFKYNIYGDAYNITCPVLITHGSSDIIVPFFQSIHLYESLRNSKEKHLETFKNVGHGYSEEGAWDKMASLFIEWFKRTL